MSCALWIDGMSCATILTLLHDFILMQNSVSHIKELIETRYRSAAELRSVRFCHCATPSRFNPRFTETYQGGGGPRGAGRGGGASRLRSQSGIIYCLSRGDCEKVWGAEEGYVSPPSSVMSTPITYPRQVAEELNELFRGSPINIMVK